VLWVSIERVGRADTERDDPRHDPKEANPMIPLLYEPELLSIDATFPARGLRPGIAFVPCGVCSAPVDLAGLGDVAQRALCDAHARPVLVASLD
jgi:hypothetical protein